MQPPGNIHLCVLSLKLSSQEWTASASSYADLKPQISAVSSKRRPRPTFRVEPYFKKRNFLTESS